ncbi:resuscitation-promoting factor [Ruania albidiflava]|uniref:resuscitation-promoting factor n=1 Tax=Ruania albidiflava TaxID=366586 RepID=UPI0023F45454|nr:resuscitation-promoting factor [Ruania albidiflava]
MSFFDRFRRPDVPTTDEAAEPAHEAPDVTDQPSTTGAAPDATAAAAGERSEPAEETAQLDLGAVPADEAEPAEETDTADAAGVAAAETGPSARRGRRRVLLGAAAATVLVLAGSGVAVAAAHKTVDIDLDGETYTFSTFAGSVDGLLDEAGIEIGPHDAVVPGADEALSDGADVVVRTGDQITITTDGEQQLVWTTALTAEEALTQLISSGRDASLEASRSSDGRTELDLPLITDGAVTIVVDDEERSIDIDGSATLQQVLVKAEITLGNQDEVNVTMGEDGAPVVTVVRHTTETRTETRVVEHDSVQRETDELYDDQSRVVQEGRDGERTITYRDHLVDGEVVDSKELSDEVTTDPVDRVVEVGTAERPAPEPEPAPEESTSSSGGSSSSGDSGGSDDSGDSENSGGSDDTGGSGGSSGAGSGVWAELAECESGGDPTTNTGNGYYGLYQFSLPTWQAMGGSGLPSEASAAEQTQRAQALQAQSGWGQWPACAAQLGLL